jgi:hypothetical protein
MIIDYWYPGSLTFYFFYHRKQWAQTIVAGNVYHNGNNFQLYTPCSFKKRTIFGIEKIKLFKTL